MTSSTVPVNNLSELSGDYVLDVVHSRIGFAVRHAMVAKIRGQFNEFAGALSVNPEDHSKSSAHLTIKVASIDTRSEARDTHLRSSDFLSMDEFPEITFVSTGVQVTSEQTVELTGDLTIKAVTKSITVPFEYLGASIDPFGEHRIGFEGSAVINRKDYDVSWNMALETGGFAVSDKVTLEFEIGATKVR